MSTVFLIISIFTQLSTDHSEMVAMLGVQAVALVIVIGCHVSGLLKTKIHHISCSLLAFWCGSAQTYPQRTRLLQRKIRL